MGNYSICNIIDTLSNREIAALILGIVYFLCAMRRSSARMSVVDVFIALRKGIMALFVFVLAPVLVGSILLGIFTHIDLSTWKDILVWAVTSVLLSYSFKINTVKSIKCYFKVLGNIILSIPLIWFVIDYTSFSIWWELLILFISFYLSKLYFFDELNRTENISVKKFVRFLYYGFFIIWGYSFYETLQNPTFWSTETLQTFFIVPFFTIIYATLVYPILLVSEYESTFKAINDIIDPKLRAAYRYKIWTFCKFNLNKISHCNFYIYNLTYQSSDTLKYTIDTSITSYRKQRNDYKFKIIREDHNTKVENYHVFLDIKEVNRTEILEFVDYFRKNHTTRQANISIYDSEVVTPFCHLNKGLSNEQQSLLSKHWIGYSTFVLPMDVRIYPEQ